MTNTGIVIGRPIEGISLNGLEYLLNNKDELRHFSSFTESRNFLAENAIDEDTVILQCHVYCMNCGKEHYLNENETASDELGAFYYCKDCESSFDI